MHLGTASYQQRQPPMHLGHQMHLASCLGPASLHERHLQHWAPACHKMASHIPRPCNKSLLGWQARPLHHHPCEMGDNPCEMGAQTTVGKHPMMKGSLERHCSRADLDFQSTTQDSNLRLVHLMRASIYAGVSDAGIYDDGASTCRCGHLFIDAGDICRCIYL